MYSGKVILALAALPLIAACSSGTVGGTSAEAAYQALASENQDLRNEYDGNALSTRAELPQFGGATYSGTSVIRLPTGSATPTSLIGEANLTSNFTSNTVTGQIDNFAGVIRGGQAQTFNGALNLTSGTIDNLANIRTNIDGNLSSGTNTLSVNGAMSGNFLDNDFGVPGSAISATLNPAGRMILDGQLFVVPLGGSPTNGLSIIAERD